MPMQKLAAYGRDNGEPRHNRSVTRLVGLNLQDPSVSEFRAMCMEGIPQAMSSKMKMTLLTSLVISTKRLHLHQVHQAQEIHGDRGTSVNMSLRHSLAPAVIEMRQSAQ